MVHLCNCFNKLLLLSPLCIESVANDLEPRADHFVCATRVHSLCEIMCVMCVCDADAHWKKSG